MRLNVPLGKSILRVVLLGASNLDLLETPLWQVDIAGAKVAAQFGVLQSESGGQSPDLGAVVRGNILDNLDSPVVLRITNSGVSVTRNLLIRLGNWCWDVVRVKVAAGLGVDETENIAVSDELWWSLLIVVWLSSVWVEPPLVVRILVVIASNLLLSGSIWVGLNVGVEKTSTVPHVLDGCAGAVSDLKWRVLSDFGTSEVGLEEGAHLGVSWSGVFENGEVSGEGEHVDDDWDNNQATNSGHDVCAKLSLWHLVVSELVPEILNGVEPNQGGNEESNPLNTADTADAESGQCQPCEPLEAEALVLESVESSPAENRGKGEAEKHRVEKDESADSRVGVLAEDHKSDEPHRWALEVELLSGEVCQRDADGAEEGIE